MLYAINASRAQHYEVMNGKDRRCLMQPKSVAKRSHQGPGTVSNPSIEPLDIRVLSVLTLPGSTPRQLKPALSPILSELIKTSAASMMGYRLCGDGQNRRHGAISG